MADSTSCPEPKVVVYHPVTGVPEEYHDFLHKDSDEYKRLKESLEASTTGAPEADSATSAVAGLTLNVRLPCSAINIITGAS